jgi:hypothetical protein
MMLVCNWLHSVEQNHFYVMMLLYKGSVIFRSLLIQSYGSRRFCTNSKSEKSDPLHSSRRRDILFGRSTVQASSVRMTRTFCLDLPLCREALNCSKLHPFGCLSNTSGAVQCSFSYRIFFPKHRYGKTAATIQTMCVPVRTRSFIRQVVHSKFNCLDNSLHGPDTQASYMEIACIRSTVRTTAVMVRTRQALIWKLRAAKVQPFGCGLIQERISTKLESRWSGQMMLWTVGRPDGISRRPDSYKGSDFTDL